MKWMYFISFSLLIGSFGLAPVYADEIGDRAKPLEISEWVKGKKDIDVTDGKSVYVVEFWATWCGPCISSIPHLTKLQEEYNDKVVFIGISTETAEKVKPFVEKQGDKMNYTIALDKEEKCQKNYMTAYHQKGIPCAFIIDREGLVVWVGHPLRMDEPLKKVVEGTYDLKEEKKGPGFKELYSLAKRNFLLCYARDNYIQTLKDNNQEKQEKLEKEILKYFDGKGEELVSLANMFILFTEGKSKEFSIRLINASEEAFQKEGRINIDTNGDVNRAFIYYMSGDFDNGDLSAEKALSEIDESQRDYLEKILQRFKKMGESQQKTIKYKEAH